MDREHVFRNLRHIIKSFSTPETKCKVYLLHGDLTEGQVQSLYTNPKIKCLINLSHGEGFGLPLFDAACHGLPIITSGWSGHCDFLYALANNGKKKAMFADVNYDIKPVQKHAVWDGVVQKDSMWCFPHEGHYKIRLRQVRKNYDKWLKKSKILQEWVLKEFESKKQHNLFAEEVYSFFEGEEEIDKMFDKIMENIE